MRPSAPAKRGQMQPAPNRLRKSTTSDRPRASSGPPSHAVRKRGSPPGLIISKP